MAHGRSRRLRRKVYRALAATLVLGTFGLALSAMGTWGTVHYTARSEFCNSCHIMEPYYESWESSSHAHVACIECHYEPGAVETLEGKFKALSQLSKYVTRTQGTKPWAEVSDYSCMRSGCHVVRTLDGEIRFGRVAFNHRHHLLESRRGRRLRCVTCHSQIVQGEHVSVTSSVCFMCHFMPGPKGEFPEKTGDCLICHGPPEEPVEVNGRDFVHADFVERGVACRECHDPVVEGRGMVGPERCHSCHGEVGHIERFGETEFLHEMHVTEHKVECFECHDDIRHGLLPIEPTKPAEAEGCGTCHASSHDSAGLVYAGTGAAGVADAPSRMYETRVVCGACHTGRAGRRFSGGSPDPHGPLPRGHGGSVALAGNVDCIHCHGPGFDGMLARWQRSVGGELERLRPLVADLEDALAERPDDSARAALAEARQNVDLVALDGSLGAHNPTYALAALRVGAERIDLARELLGVPAEASATAGMPFVSKAGCSTCHLGVEQVVAVAPGGGAFPHGPHLSGAGLECSTCHELVPPGRVDHGAPALDRSGCVSCHHAEDGPADPFDCAACHSAQEELLLGSLPGHADGLAPKADMDCGECHGEPPDLTLPSERLCQLCHGSGFEGMLASLQGTVGGELARLAALLDEADSALRGASDDAAREDVETARAVLDALAHDGSRGVHDPPLALAGLTESAQRIDRARARLGLSDASAGRPDLPPADCASCHADIARAEVVTESGRRFPHGSHLSRASLSCADCHQVELTDHRMGGGGAGPAAARRDCTSCHHSEGGAVDPWECSTCHSAQDNVLLGELAGFEGEPGTKADMECTDCHGEPPDVGMPNEALCRLCHDEESRAGFDAFRRSVDERLSALSTALDHARERGADPAAVERARRAYEALRADGTLGAHNSVFVEQVLDEALGAVGAGREPEGGEDD